MHYGQLRLTGNITDVKPVAHSGRALAWIGLLGLLTLAGCATNGTRAPVVDLSNNTAPTPGARVATYVVRPGDTLYKIAHANNVDIEKLKRWNGLADPNQLTVGQVLHLSENGAPPLAAAASTGTQAAAVAGGTKTEPKPLDEATDKQATDAVKAEPRPSPAADAGVINWAWPASGALIQTFNTNTKGIDIAGKTGDPVTAAADGKVMYSGNGVRGLGNLIIINHQNGFITAYAHNRALLVKPGQVVKRGVKIAEVGQTDASTPRLHFEIRRQGTPVDPMRYLPQR